MAYIKSHSNYVYKKRHQSTNNGTIYERDITTIGGVDKFTPGQIPVYKSGNFLITVNNENYSSRYIANDPWVENSVSGSVWTNDIAEVQIDETTNNNEVVIKNDYYKLEDFAYYASLTDVVKTALTDIEDGFPGELYFSGFDNATGVNPTPLIEVYYSEKVNGVITQKRLGGETYYAISNPYDINSCDEYIETDDEIGYFGSGGMDNYYFIDGNEKEYECNFIGIDYEDAMSYIKINGEEGFIYNSNPYLKIYLTYNLSGETKTIKMLPSDGVTNVYHLSEYGITSYEMETAAIEEEDVVKIFNNAHSAEFYDALENDVFMDTTSQRIDEIPGLEFISAEFFACIGDIIGEVTYRVFLDEPSEVELITAYVGIGDDFRYYYLIDSENPSETFTQIGFHIRPYVEFYNAFINNLSNFQKILLNTKTEPKYKATFEVYDENDYGYSKSLEVFVYPLGLGGYNLGTDTSAYSEYAKKFFRITEFYDERFSDNLYRSMTHDSIKNLDWSFSRERDSELEEIYGDGGDRISTMIHTAALEFDIIKDYIANIEANHAISYQGYDNAPDYEITDYLDLDGWDVKLIYPYSLTESTDSIGEISGGTLTEEDELSNSYSGETLHRVFEQMPNATVKPFTKKNITEEKRDGYFLGCDECGPATYIFDVKPKIGHSPKEGISIGYDVVSELATPVVGVIPSSGLTYYTDCAGSVRNVIHQYSNENDYTYSDINLEFVKRLKINSRYIMRHKGTIEGIDMLLGMFGMKNKNWFDSLPEAIKPKYSTITVSSYTEYDVSAKENDFVMVDGEKVEITHASEQDVDLDVISRRVILKSGRFFPYDYEIKEYTLFTPRIDEIYSTKHYDNLVDWYNKQKTIGYSSDAYVSGEYTPYQGLPVAYFDDDLTYQTPSGYTTDSEDENIYTDEDGEKVHARYIYPYFDSSYDEYDGNPIYQMNGGWEFTDPIKFDKDNNILSSSYSTLYKETIQTSKKVSNIEELLSLYSQSLTNGQIYYVADLSTDLGVVDGQIYPLTKDENGYYYMEFDVVDGGVSIGNAYFTDSIFVSTPYTDTKEDEVTIPDKTDGYWIRVFLLKDENDEYYIKAYHDYESVSTFASFIDGKYKNDDDLIQYFRINDKNYCNELTSNGWTQLHKDDKDFYKLNSINDYFEGNNPHTGNLKYDKGHAYLTYFKELFKYANENNQYSDYCIDDEDIQQLGNYTEPDYYTSLFETEDNYEQIDVPFGFRNLVRPNENDIDYDYYLNEDTKIHYFGDFAENGYYMDTVSGVNYYHYDEYYPSKSDYSLTDIDSVDGVAYGSNINMQEKYTVDNVTHQIVNTKRMEFIFYLHSTVPYSQEYLKEIKYIQCVIMPYLEQMIPSSIIWNVRYVTWEEKEYFKDIVGADDGTLKLTITPSAKIVPASGGMITLDAKIEGYVVLKYKIHGTGEIDIEEVPVTIDANARTSYSISNGSDYAWFTDINEIIVPESDIQHSFTITSECVVKSLTIDGKSYELPKLLTLKGDDIIINKRVSRKR